MYDLAANRDIKNDSERLVSHISKRWPEEHMSSVRDDMQYGQYAEAVLDIIAIHFKHRMPLEKTEVQQIRSLVDRMKIGEDAVRLLAHLRKHDDQPAVVEAEPIAAFLL